MKIVFCWSDISGYMVACWRALAACDGIDLHILSFGNNNETEFDLKMSQELNFIFVDRNPESSYIRSIIEEIDPNVIILCGWFVKAYRELPSNVSFSNVKFLLTMDTPWQGLWKQKIATLALRNFVSKMDAVLTSGERGYQYANRLGARRVYKLQYGVDHSNLKQNYTIRAKNKWPTSFLYVGRYSKEKGIDIMLKSYREYRNVVDEPWELHACGKGQLDHLMVGEGIHNHGFVQPRDMNNIWQMAGCLVLPSTFDPWPLIVVEACAAGLPVICTHESGSQVEIVKVFWNGLVVNSKDFDDLRDALCYMHQHYEILPEMGKRSIDQAQPYDAHVWAEKILNVIAYTNC